MKLLKRPATGTYAAVLSNRRRLPLGTTCKAEARQRLSTLQSIDDAAKVGALTDEAFKKLTGRTLKCGVAVAAYLQELTDLKHPVSTIRTRRDHLSKWLRNTRLGGEHLASITPLMLSDWVNAPGKAGKGTRQQWVLALKGLFKWGLARGHIGSDPSFAVKVDLSRLSHAQKETRQRLPFTGEQVDALLKAARYCEKHSAFWLAAIRISAGLGLRFGDICQLEWATIGTDTITVWTDKRDKRVQLALTPELRSMFDALPIEDMAYVFPEVRLVYLETPKYLPQQFGRLAKRAGLPGRTFHELRHTYATRCHEAGIPMPHIAGSLGHSSTATTAGYVH